MKARLRPKEAIAWAGKLGLVAYQQRGFYSHFIRVRTVDYVTLGTLDIYNGLVSRRQFNRIIAKIA